MSSQAQGTWVRLTLRLPTPDAFGMNCRAPVQRSRNRKKEATLGKHGNSLPPKDLWLNSAIRDGWYIDPYTNKPKYDATVNMQKDHIYPQKDIKGLPGFKELTPTQQTKILNMEENFQPLPSGLNQSKGSRVNGKWKRYKSKNKDLDVDYIKWLNDEQKKLLPKIEAEIDAILGGAP